MMAAVVDEDLPCLQIFSLKPAEGPWDPFCILNLPMSGYKVILLDLTISSDPSSGSPTGAFSTSPYDTLYTVTYDAWSGERPRKSVFFIPLSTVLRHALPRFQLAPPQELDADVEWEEWGPLGTRCVIVNRALSDVWTCHTSGMKCVVARISSRKGSAPSLRLCDFSNALGGQESAFGDPASVVPNSIPASPRMFDMHVKTHLPFRCYDKDLAMFEEGEFKATMMSEDSLILVTVGSPPQLWVILSNKIPTGG